jgi:uncharacterized membrane protein YhaH (DUF805 family)
MDSPVRVVFYGEVRAGFAVGDVKRELARVFKLDEAKVAAMFSGGRTVLKRSLPPEEGARYLAKLESLGARVHLEPVPEAPGTVAHGGNMAMTRQAVPAHPAAPVQSVASTASAPASPALGGLALVPAEEEQMECPTCGERQSKRILCRSCATDMARGIAAKKEAEEDARAARLEEARARRGLRPSYATSDHSDDEAPALMGFGFSGRLARWPYAASGLFCWAAMIGCIVAFVRNPGFLALAVLLVALLLVSLWSLRVTVLRLHDVNLSGWWVLLLFVPYVGGLASLLLMFWPGTHGDNDHGGPARPGNWLLAMASLMVLCLTVGMTWRTLVLAGQGLLPMQAEYKEAADRAHASEQGPPSAEQLSLLIPSPQAVEAFRGVYWTQPSHKAFAISADGAWGWESGLPSAEKAAERALAACDANRQPYAQPCVLINVDGYGEDDASE